MEEALQHPWINPDNGSLPARLNWEGARDELDLTQQVSPVSQIQSSEPSPEPQSPEPESVKPCNGLSPGSLSTFTVDSIENVPTPLKPRSWVPGRNIAYSPPVDKNRSTPEKRSRSSSPRELLSPETKVGLGKWNEGPDRLAATEPAAFRQGRFELDSVRFKRTGSLSNVQSLQSLITVTRECGQKLMQVTSALQGLPDGVARNGFGQVQHDILSATAPMVPCSRTRSPIRTEPLREVQLHTHTNPSKRDTSPFHLRTELRGRENIQPYMRPSTLASDPAACIRRVARPCVSRVYAPGYNSQVMDSLSKTTPFPIAQRECCTPVVPMHDFIIPCTTTTTTTTTITTTTKTDWHDDTRQIVSRHSPTLTPPSVQFRELHWQPNVPTSHIQMPVSRETVTLRRRRPTVPASQTWPEHWPVHQVAARY